MRPVIDDPAAALAEIAAVSAAELRRLPENGPVVRSEIYELLGGCLIESPEGPPTMEALSRIAGVALGALLRLMEDTPEPYMEANADIIREAWCSLDVVNLTGPPHNV